MAEIETQGADLTDKHREVLDRLLDHKSSKQIAHELGISPKTVDQRILAAAKKLGTTDRRSTARAYSQMRQAWERTPYPFSYVPQPDQSADEDDREAEVAAFSLGDSQVFHRRAPWEIAQPTVLPGMFHGPSGTVSRLAAIVGLAIAMLVTAMVGLGVAQALTELLRAG
jgi:DNA-binding CsgD family transcriptional regulator